jgi:carboxylesterase
MSHHKRSLPPSTPEPFSASGSKGSILLLHGFTSSPYEMRVVGEAFAEAGYAVDAPLLPGHGTDVSDLIQTRADDWLRASEAALDRLSPDMPLWVAGASMGGLLALLLATTSKRIQGLILLAPALLLRPAGRFAATVAPLGAHRIRETIEKEAPGGDIACAEAREKNATYPVLPFAGIAEFDRVRQMALRKLHDVKVPICVFQGQKDGTVDPASVELLLRQSNGLACEAHYLPKSQHILGLDLERDLVCERALRFVEETTPKSRAFVEVGGAA